MSDDVLVKVEGVSKKFCSSLKRSLWYGLQDVTHEVLGRSGQFNELRKNEFWAVNDISFELKRGQCLGLIGPNGAGKSTLLKMLNGLVKPDRGRITMKGRIGALIELGAGFNPILTARENIYVNGSVLGFKKKEIDSKFDSIVDFAEIEDFLDMPVQNFSSGMKVRLGFSIASQLNPDVMLIDEILAVGDASFKAKCMAKMYDQLGESCVIFVSHSMAQINRICTEALYIRKGLTEVSLGQPSLAIEKYLEDCTSPEETYLGIEDYRIGDFELQTGGLLIDNRQPRVDFGSGLEFSIFVDFLKGVDRCAFMLAFFDQELRNVAECYSGRAGFEPCNIVGRNRVEVGIDSLNLSPGRYSVQFSCVKLDANGRRVKVLFVVRDLFQVQITGGDYSYASTQYLGSWNISDH